LTRSTKYSRTADLLTPATRKKIGAAFDEAAALLARGIRSPLYGIARAFAYHQRYSVRNRLLLWGQAQHSRMARSRRGWAALGRQVLPGAPAYYVIQPADGSYGVLDVYDVDFTRGKAVRLTPASVRLAKALPGMREEAAGAAAALIEGEGLETELARLSLLYALGLFSWYPTKTDGAGENPTGRRLFRLAENALKTADRTLKVLEKKQSRRAA